VNSELTPWRWPDAPLRASVLTSKLVALAAVVALAGAARAALPLGDAYALKAAVLFTAITGLSIGFLQQHHPFERFGPANQITTLRAILVALVAALVGEPRVAAIATAAVGAGLTVTVLDGVDGWLARRHEIASRFGARFDMEVDALLILALSVLAWRYGKAGAWVIASGLMRYLFVAAGAVVPWLRASLEPNRRRQAICVLQIATLAAVMLPAIEPPLSGWLSAAALAALTYSFAIDTLWLWRHRA
jgi:phosphatidylglycerophosphate synthase